MYEEVTPASAKTTVGTDALQKALERELAFGHVDERSYSWFHGKIPRNVAEDLVRREGDFLIRESLVKEKEYVLTCKYKSAYYHFKINADTALYPTVRYCLEDQEFESLPALVRRYLDEKRPVSLKTGVILSQAVNRTVPISYSEVKYASLKKESKLITQDNQNLNRPSNTNNNSNIIPSQTAVATVPPKPSRVPSVRGTQKMNFLGMHMSPTTLSYAKNCSSPSGVISPVSSNSNPGFHSTSRSGNHGVSMRNSQQSRSRKLQELASKRRKRASCFKPAQYRCTMLSSENPPLEANALSEMKTILFEADPFKLARHMTVIDCKICHVMDDAMEQIYLPHAFQLRQDILERYQCIAFWVVICIVKCTNGKKERIEMLNKMIQIANELVHSMGNVFGFSAVMHGLCCPQVSTMSKLWEALTLQYTNNAVTFTKKLRPLLHRLDQGKDDLRIEMTCIPHIMPLVRLLEHRGPIVSHSGSQESPSLMNISSGSLTEKQFSTAAATSLNWWENIPDDSFDSLLQHLHSGRLLIQNHELCKKIANNRLIDFKEVPKIREMFTTDFQMRILFGFRSSESPRKERYDKFDRIISALVRLIVD